MNQWLTRISLRSTVLALSMLIWSFQVHAQLADLTPPENSMGAWHIETLQVSDNLAYYQGYTASQALLQRTLGWGWPSAKQTPEGNEDTMRFHVEQHAQHRAFSYVIRDPEERALRGAVFINPVQSRVGLPGFGAHNFQVEVTFWLNQQGQESSQVDQLLPQLSEWLTNEWGIRTALFPVARSNSFAMQQLERHGFAMVTEDRNNDEILYSFRAR